MPMIISIRNKSKSSLDYILNSPSLKFFWTKHDFYSIIHFLSHDDKLWDFGIPTLMQSNLAHRWFFSENE